MLELGPMAWCNESKAQSNVLANVHTLVVACMGNISIYFAYSTMSELAIKKLPSVDLYGVEDQFGLLKPYSQMQPAMGITSGQQNFSKQPHRVAPFKAKMINLHLICLRVYQLTTWAANGNIFSGGIQAQRAKQKREMKGSWTSQMAYTISK